MTELLTSPRFRLAVEALLTLLLVGLGVRLILTLTAPPDAPALSFAPPRHADLAVLGRFDPFFREAAGGTPASEAEAGQWTLHGVRAGGGSFDTAILSGPDGRQAVYRLGEAVAPGMILAAVSTDHVRISRGGTTFRVGFPDASGGAAQSGPALAEPVLAQTPSTPVSAARFVAEAALSPRRRGERTDGYVLQPRGRGDTLAAAGLRAGDVILSVNGMSMNAERAAELETELTAGATAEIQYERDGQRRGATLRIEAGQPG